MSNAADFKIGEEITGTLNATTTFGTTIRTESPDPAVLGALASARVGGPPGQLSGNTGGNNLNFQKNRPVSTVLKAVADVELKWRNLGLFARVRAWHDFELKEGARAYGNIPNGFSQGAPLSDSGFDPSAKFSNARLADIYAFGNFAPDADVRLDLKFGRQVLNWGVAQLTSGGIEAIDARDTPAQVRPGALPQEGRLPAGMLYARLGAGSAWAVEGFAQYEFRPTVLLPCGVFFTASNFSATGCNYASVVGTLDDAAALASERYAHRAADVPARDGGQAGVSLRYRVAAIGTELRGFGVNLHSRTPSIRVINPNVAGGYGLGTTTRLTDPNGLKYAMVYAQDIKLYGLGFDTTLDPASRLYGEIAYRPNQPIGLNATDLVGAFVGRSATSALNLAKGTNAIAPGGTFDGYDRFRVVTASVGASKALPGALGAQRVSLQGEIGGSWVHGLPDPGTLRYGRADSYGSAAIDGQPCIDTTAAQKACAHDGFVTRNAWGYRVRASARYPGAWLEAALTPSVGLARDVRGYSYDGGFLQGRSILTAGLRAEWPRRYFGEVLYTRVSGGAYNLQTDTDRVTLTVGMHL